MGLVALIQFRRGTSTEWTSVNPILESGEPGYETNTGKFKIGTGYTIWTELPYFTGGVEGLLATAEELNRLHLVTPGTASPGKALVVDNLNNLNLNGGNLTVNNIVIEGNLEVDSIDGGEPDPRITNIKIRRGTETQWSTENPILSMGEFGWDSTNKILKIGNDSDTWLELPIIASANPMLLGTNADILTKTTIRSSEIDFTNTGSVDIFTVPPDFIFSINTFEVVTTDIEDPDISPTISFGDSLNSESYYASYILQSNDTNARHIIESPQDAIVENTTVQINVSNASTATTHKGYAIVSGDLLKINY